MQLIDFRTACSPALNLAREEHLFRRMAEQDDLLLFYINTDAVVIGRSQVPWAETSAAGLAKTGLPLVRRISGGGAVYHDPGNLNFSILLQDASAGRPSAAAILQPVVRALHALGLPARLSERNAIFIGRHKVSGTAQYMTAGKILTHGTLLVHADLDRLESCLTADPGYQIHSRGRASVRRPVTNLHDLRADITMDVLRRAIQRAFADAWGPVRAEKPRHGDERAAAALAAGKYRSWEWNCGRSPRFRIAWADDYLGRNCRCRMEVRRGLVTQVDIEGAAGPDGRLQHLARQRLVGKSFARPSHPGHDQDARQALDNDEDAFLGWLEAHLPPPLPLPGAL